MSLALAPRRPSALRRPPGSPLAAERPFTRVDVCESLEEARLAWATLAQEAPASAYQGFAFARAWFATIGAAEGATPLIFVARDDAGAPVALLPLTRFRRGALRLAGFFAGKDANYNLGLFRPGGAWREEDVDALLREAGRHARLDAFMFICQPERWSGVANPMASARRQPSPSFAYASALPHEFSIWLDARASKDAKKKMRKKRAKLEATAPVVHAVAADAAAVDRALAAYHAQCSARAATLGVPDPYDSPAARGFLIEMARDGTLELHTVSHGERIIAVFGALPAGDRLSGLFITHDSDPEIARSSPGEIMVHAVVANAIARGFTAFDLGVGEARYKDEACEIVEPLFDSAFGVTLRGRVAAAAFLAARRAKGWAKRSPRLKALRGRLVRQTR